VSYSAFLLLPPIKLLHEIGFEIFIGKVLKRRKGSENDWRKGREQEMKKRIVKGSETG
jgi:hypothetical protein